MALNVADLASEGGKFFRHHSLDVREFLIVFRGPARQFLENRGISGGARQACRVRNARGGCRLGGPSGSDLLGQLDRHSGRFGLEGLEFGGLLFRNGVEFQKVGDPRRKVACGRFLQGIDALAEPFVFLAESRDLVVDRFLAFRACIGVRIDIIGFAIRFGFGLIRRSVQNPKGLTGVRVFGLESFGGLLGSRPLYTGPEGGQPSEQ
jgi:hypothetical protein